VRYPQPQVSVCSVPSRAGDEATKRGLGQRSATSVVEL